MIPLDAILAFVEEHGWRIFPSLIIGKRKQPIIKNWQNACSRDPRQITVWWREYPDAIPSLVTGPRNGIVILDVDRDTDPETGLEYDGWDSIEKIFKWDTVPETPCVHTRRGGRHFYYSCPKMPDDDIASDDHPMHRHAIRNSVSILAPHVDVRGWNGYVNLPVEGTGYWIDPVLNFSVPMKRAPHWFNHRPRKPVTPRDHNGRFDPNACLADACRQIREATARGRMEGYSRHNDFRWATFRIARLVGLGLLDRNRAYYDLAAEVMALGIDADNGTARVQKYFEMAWNEGLAAARERRK